MAKTTPRAEDTAGQMTSAPSSSGASEPQLVHDGESYRIYRAILPATDFDGANASTAGTRQGTIDVAIKTLRSNGYGDMTALNNEFNILKLRHMANCRSARTALKIDRSFEEPHRSENGGASDTTAVYFEWAEGTTLSDWLEGKGENGTMSGKDESARLLNKVRVASMLADAVANIHEAGIVHNDLNEDNVIVSFNDDDAVESDEKTTIDRPSPCRVTLVDFKYADQSSGLEGDDEGDRVNDDVPQLAAMLRDIFAVRGGDYADRDRATNSSDPNLTNSSDPPKMCRRLSFGYTRGDFSGTFHPEGSKSRESEHSVYDFGACGLGDDDDDDERTSKGGGSRTSIMFGDMGDATTNNARRLPPNLPRSVRRVLADARDAGRVDRETAYRNAREVAEDLLQLASDPAVFLADPSPGDTTKMTFRRPPRRLYGRENELKELRSAEGRLMDENRGSGEGSRTEVVLIAGRSGTGKSSLLRQARSDSKAVFAVGKFDQLKSTQPYSALIAAFDKIVNSILSEHAAVVDDIKEAILNAVGKNGKVLTDVIPSLVKVIGEQPDVAHRTGIEAQNRFRYIVTCFARAICTPQRPLILVLDDLQWCDSASIDLVKTLVTDKSNKYLLFVGCYRDDEMNADHHVSLQFNSMKEANVNFTKIQLGNMSVDSLTSFVSERLRLPRRLVKSLSEIVHRKSLGNAFFATMFLQSLAEGGLLSFSPAKVRWIWDEAEADANNISDDVVEVMAEKIQTLQPGLQGVLKKASCIGATFDVSTVTSLTPEASASCDFAMDDQLDKLVKEGLIIRMRTGDINDGATRYKFSHDRIQQAAYSLMPKNERETLHLCIGRILEKRLSDTNAVGSIFQTVDQLNRGAECITDQDERIELAVLNARAAEDAYKACAFTPSTAFVHKSFGILGNEDAVWSDHYSLALRLYNLLAELMYCEGNFNAAMQITQYVFKKAKTFDDQFIAQTCNVKSMILCGDLNDAMAACLDILRTLGQPLPKKPNIGAILADLIKTKKALWKKSDKDLSSLPEVTDTRIKQSMQILNICASITYHSSSNYLAIVSLKMVRLMLTYGQTEYSNLGFCGYGILIYAALKDVQGSCRFGQLGLSLSNKTYMPRNTFAMYALIVHWREHIEVTLDPLLKGYKVGLEIGDEYALYNANLYNIHRLHSGRASIQDIVQHQHSCLRELTKNGGSSNTNLLLPALQAALNLGRQSKDPVVLSGKFMKEEELLSRSPKMIEYYIRVEAACVAYIFGDYDRASMHSLKIQDFADKFPGGYLINVQAFYDGLSSYALARNTSNRKKWRKRGRKMMKKFVKWAEDCPSNNAHKALLLKAEDASLFARKSTKKRVIAEEAYNAAILDASENGFVHVAAIASERAAEFFKSIGQDEEFLRHIAQAHHLYSKWGADGKCDCIAKKYPQIRSKTHTVRLKRNENASGWALCSQRTSEFSQRSNTC